MIDTKAMRAKYAKRGRFTPAGASDVLALCDELERSRHCLSCTHNPMRSKTKLHCVDCDCATHKNWEAAT